MKRVVLLAGLAFMVAGLLPMAFGTGTALADPPPLKLHITDCHNVPLEYAEVKVSLYRGGLPVGFPVVDTTDGNGDCIFPLTTSQVGDNAKVQYHPDIFSPWDVEWFQRVTDPADDWIIGVQPTDHCQKNAEEVNDPSCCDSPYGLDPTFWHIHYILKP